MTETSVKCGKDCKNPRTAAPQDPGSPRTAPGTEGVGVGTRAGGLLPTGPLSPPFTVAPLWAGLRATFTQALHVQRPGPPAAVVSGFDSSVTKEEISLSPWLQKTKQNKTKQNKTKQTLQPA